MQKIKVKNEGKKMNTQYIIFFCIDFPCNDITT